MRFAARLFLTGFLIFFFSFFLLTPVHAQTANPYTAPNTDTNVPANLHTYTQSLVLETLSAFTCQITGQDPLTANHECLGLDTTTGKIGYVPSSGGALGFVGNMIASLYTPPINSVQYIHYVASNFGIVKHAYAANAANGSSVAGCSGNGCGFDKLTPLLGLWTTFRNISYAVFVIIFVVIGFAIMLRVKIDPRTVMSIENQIPKIIIALLLVTFSYAIAGFLIDMMYATTYLVINVVASSEKAAGYNSTVDNIHHAESTDLTGGNPLGFANDIIPGGILGVTAGSSGSVRELIQGLFNTPLVPPNSPNGGGGIQGGITGGAVGAGLGIIGCGVIGIFTEGIGFLPCVGLIGGLAVGGAAAGGLASAVGNIDVKDITLNALGWLISGITGLLAFLIIAVALLVALFRVWFTLLLAYVSILLDIVLAPFYIIAGVFPGSKIGFSSWLKGMIGNLLAFPVTIGLFVLAGVFMDNFSKNTGNLFVPPLIGNPNSTVGNGQSPVAYLIALGMILLTPNAVGLTRGLVGAGENKALAGIFQGIGVGSKTVGGMFKRTSGAIFGQEITYTREGQIKPISNPVEKLWRGFINRG